MRCPAIPPERTTSGIRRSAILLVGRHHLVRLLLLAWHEQPSIELFWVDDGLSAIGALRRRVFDAVITGPHEGDLDADSILEIQANWGDLVPLIRLGTFDGRFQKILQLDRPAEIRYLIDAVYYAASPGDSGWSPQKTS